jgi:hypothetical protein
VHGAAVDDVASKPGCGSVGSRRDDLRDRCLCGCAVPKRDTDTSGGKRFSDGDPEAPCASSHDGDHG